MTIDRRRFLAASAGAAALAAAPASARPAQSAPTPSLDERLREAARANAHALTLDGGRFGGPAWELLLAEGRAAQFFLIGEEHGIAENPKLAAQLFAALSPAGYARLGIEISSVMAGELDAAARGGVAGIRGMFEDRGAMLAFFGMREEAEMIAAVRTAVKGPAPALWGFDYEVGADRRLLTLLERAPKPAAARDALAALRSASDASWARYDAEGDPKYIFSFAGDPAMAAAIRAAWPGIDARSAWIVETLERTFAINKAWTDGKGWLSNHLRAQFMRDSFLRLWRAEKRKPRAMFKMGANHLVRGRTSTAVFDLGTLIRELAAIEGSQTFGMCVLPGLGREVAALDPVKWRYAPVPSTDSYGEGLAFFGELAGDRPTLFDLRPLRPILSGRREKEAPAELMRTVHGYDTLLILGGSTASANL